MPFDVFMFILIVNHSFFLIDEIVHDINEETKNFIREVAIARNIDQGLHLDAHDYYSDDPQPDSQQIRRAKRSASGYGGSHMIDIVKDVSASFLCLFKQNVIFISHSLGHLPFDPSDE